MGAIYDDLPGHEGFAVREHDHGVAAWFGACGCGWRDDRAYAADDAGYEAAVDRWDIMHAAPLVARAVPTDVAELVEQARRAVARLARTRPHAAAVALDGIERWCAGLRREGVMAEPRPPTVQERFDAFAERARAERPRLGR